MLLPQSNRESNSLPAGVFEIGRRFARFAFVNQHQRRLLLDRKADDRRLAEVQQRFKQLVVFFPERHNPKPLRAPKILQARSSHSAPLDFPLNRFGNEYLVKKRFQNVQPGKNAERNQRT